MPRVVPSQVIQLIEQLFPQALTNKHFALGTGPALMAIVNFAKQIPPELLRLSGQDLSDYVVALEYMESTERRTLALQRGLNVPEYRDCNVLALLRDALAKCPDEAPVPGTGELPFLLDADLGKHSPRYQRSQP